jgi:hypothetical protein
MSEKVNPSDDDLGFESIPLSDKTFEARTFEARTFEARQRYIAKVMNREISPVSRFSPIANETNERGITIIYIYIYI